jgi:hypothetical protein
MLSLFDNLKHAYTENILGYKKGSGSVSQEISSLAHNKTMQTALLSLEPREVD